MNVETALELINQILFTKAGRYLRPPEVTIVEGIWQGLTYAQMSKASDYSTNYLMRDIGPKFWRQLSEVLGEPMSKTNLRVVMDRLSRTAHSPLATTTLSTLSREKSAKGKSTKKKNATSSLSQRSGAIDSVSPSALSPTFMHQGRVRVPVIPSQNWRTQSLDVDASTAVYGRTEECQRLLDWITHSSCRLIGVGGMGGIGKTSLLRMVAGQLQDQFDVIQWRSLKQGPSISDLVCSLPAPEELVLSRSSRSHSGSTISSIIDVNLDVEQCGAIAHLLDYLHTQPTLLILDDIEGILSTDCLAGQAQNIHRFYNQLFQRLNTTDHPSCVIVVGTELPRSLLQLQHQTPQTQAFILDGLPQSAAIQLLAAERLENAARWPLLPLLIDYYQGHPLALKLAAKLTQKLFHGYVSEIWEQNLCLLDEINAVFKRSIRRLSSLEQDILFLLATHSQALSLTDIQPYLPQSTSAMQLVEALDSLKQRSLLLPLQHSGQSRFTLSPIMKDSVQHYLMEQVSQVQTSLAPLSTPLFSTEPSLRLTPTTQQPICLSDWLDGKFTPAWQAIAHLFCHPQELSFRLRSLYQLRDESIIKRFKQVCFGSSSMKEKDAIILLVAIYPEADRNLKICIHSQPALQQTCLPADFSMRLLNLEGISLAQVNGTAQDSVIQLPYFNGVAQERFTIQLRLGNQKHNEDFVI